MSKTDEISRIAERIVNHPAFVNRISQLTSPIHSSRRNFSSSRDETGNLFRRQRSRTPQGRTSSASSCDIITFKEVVLLNDADQKYTIGGGQKS